MTLNKMRMFFWFLSLFWILSLQVVSHYVADRIIVIGDVKRQHYLELKLQQDQTASGATFKSETNRQIFQSIDPMLSRAMQASIDGMSQYYRALAIITRLSALFVGLLPLFIYWIIARKRRNRQGVYSEKVTRKSLHGSINKRL